MTIIDKLITLIISKKIIISNYTLKHSFKRLKRLKRIKPPKVQKNASLSTDIRLIA